MVMRAEGEAGTAVRPALFLPLLAAFRFTGHAGGSHKFTHDLDTRLRAQRAGQALLSVSHAFLLPVSATEVRLKRPIGPGSGRCCRHWTATTQFSSRSSFWGQGLYSTAKRLPPAYRNGDPRYRLSSCFPAVRICFKNPMHASSMSETGFWSGTFWILILLKRLPRDAFLAS